MYEFYNKFPAFPCIGEFVQLIDNEHNVYDGLVSRIIPEGRDSYSVVIRYVDHMFTVE